MDTDVGLSELLTLIFGKKPTIPEEMVPRSSIPSNLLTEDFSHRLAVVLRWKKYIVFRKWNHIFDGNNRGMFSSHEGYLGSVLCVCIGEHESNQNIFDSFISVCALLTYLSEATLSKVGLDFRDLNPDIAMEFYRNVLKRTSLKRKEINRFVKYIRRHEHLKWDSIEDDYALFDNLTASVSLELNEKINEELHRYRRLPYEFKSSMEKTMMHLMQKILTNTSVELPTVPPEPVLIRRLIASSKKERENKAERKRRHETVLTVETSHGDSSSNSEPKTDYFVDQQKDISWHENIIQAVIRHNHSKTFDHGNMNNPIYDGILENLKNMIQYLIEVLDECNQE